MYTDHTFWRIPIHECCTYIIYIIICIIGGRVLQDTAVGIKINARGGGNKIRFYAIICMSSWAEWERPYWPMKCTRGDFTQISVSCYDGSAIAIVILVNDARRRRRIFWCHRMMHYLRTYFCEQTTMVVTNRLPKYRSRGHRRWFSLPTVSLPWLVAWQ